MPLNQHIIITMPLNQHIITMPLNQHIIITMPLNQHIIVTMPLNPCITIKMPINQHISITMPLYQHIIITIPLNHLLGHYSCLSYNHILVRSTRSLYSLCTSCISTCIGWEVQEVMKLWEDEGSAMTDISYN